MNSSPLMDKQILSLSVPHITADFLDLASPKAEELRRTDGGGGVNKDDIIASYDFQPIRTLGSSPPSAQTLGASRPSWGSLDSKVSASNLKYANIAEPRELTKVCHGKERAAYDVATVAEVDQTVKKYADHIMHSLDGVSSRLSQMENRTRHLESSVDELKSAVENNNGTADGKLRQLQNILREVQTGIQVLRDKQEIAETKLQLKILQTSTGDHQTPEFSNSGQMDSQQPPALPQLQSVQQPIQPSVGPPQPSFLPTQAAPNVPPPPQQNQAPVEFPGQLPQTQFSSPSQLTNPSYQQYQHLSHQNQPPPPQPYHSAPQLLQYSQSPQPSQPSPSLPPHIPEESTPYGPPLQSYPPSIQQPSPQQFYGPNPSMYEPSMSRPISGQLSFSAGYGQQLGPPNFSDPYPYSGSPSHHSSSPMKSSPFSSSAASSGGNNNYQHLPTAKILPQAQQTGSSGGTTGNRVPVDDVVDKVVTMGFSRDQVRATVRKLTESGQPVDLNVVLDKLMNDGEILQPQKGWFGR